MIILYTHPISYAFKSYVLSLLRFVIEFLSVNAMIHHSPVSFMMSAWKSTAVWNDSGVLS